MDQDIPKKQITTLYANESDAIFRFCFFRTSDKEVALDLTQDTFVRFWDVLSRGEQKIENERAFLFTIARNLITDWYRKKKTLSLDALAEKADSDVELFMLDTAPREDIELQHEARYLLERLQELEPLYQQVVYLRYVEDLKPKEIAEILGESVNSISVRIHRGIKQLRKIAGYDETPTL